jgi:hypothetical protein
MNQALYAHMNNKRKMKKKKRTKTYTHNVEGLCGHHALRETDTKGPMACDCIHRKCPEQGKLESRSGLTWARGWGGNGS